MSQKISVIVVNYQNWELLKNCLQSIANLSELEIIVVDNCSPDNRLDEFKRLFPTISFVQNSGNNGFANACNLGASLANAEFLFFLNPDAIANQRIIKELLDNYQNIENIAILGVVQENEKGKKQAYEKPYPAFNTILGLARAIVSKFKFSQKHFLAKNIQEVPWVSGAAVFISKKWFDKIGGWDERFWMYFEDIALCRSAFVLNGKIGILTTPTLLHAHGGSSRINSDTTAMTKLEVMISRHVYIAHYVNGFEKYPTQVLTVLNHLLIATFQAFIGILLVFEPKGRAYIKQVISLVKYYFGVLKRGNWQSKRAVFTSKFH